jgi:hypothetical protein
MEDVAVSMATNLTNVQTMIAHQKDFWNKQMRAYITIGNGPFFAQYSNTGFRLQMDVATVNVGLTPARNVAVAFKTDVLPHPLPNGFDLTTEEPAAGDATLNPRHPYNFAVIAPKIFPEDLLWKSIRRERVSLGMFGERFGTTIFLAFAGIRIIASFAFGATAGTRIGLMLSVTMTATNTATAAQRRTARHSSLATLFMCGLRGRSAWGVCANIPAAWRPREDSNLRPTD